MGRLKYCRISTRNARVSARENFLWTTPPNYVTMPILPSLELFDSASGRFIAANRLDQNYTWVFYAEFEVGDIADEANITVSMYVRAYAP